MVMYAIRICPIYWYHSAAEGYIKGEDLQIHTRVHLCHDWGPPQYIEPMAATHVLYIIFEEPLAP